VSEQRDPIAVLESALTVLQSALSGDCADPDLANADKRLAGTQHPLAGTDEAAPEAKHIDAQQWLDVANDRAACQREAERVELALKDAFRASEQLRAALDTFITTIAPLGESGAAAAAAATTFREAVRDSAAEALHLEARRKCEILARVQAPLQPTAGAEQGGRQLESA